MRRAMMNQEAQLDFNDVAESLMTETPDEALEAAACSGPLFIRSFTVTMCTAQAECPF
jgi:hypothetical protein